MNRAVAQQFNRAANSYDTVAGVQSEIIAVLASLLPVESPSAILEIGCGTGELTEVLCSTYQTAQILAVDISAAMAAVCGRRMSHLDNCAIVELDFMRFAASRTFPLVVSASALHWIEDTAACFRQIRNLMPSEGNLIFALMVEGTFKTLHQLRRSVAPLKPSYALLPSPETLLKILLQENFVVEKSFIREFQEPLTSTNDLYTHIKKLGVSAQAAYQKHTLNRRELVLLSKAYEEEIVARYQQNCLEYCSFFVHARAV